MQKLRQPRFILAVLLPVQIVIIKFLALFPEFVERHYSNSVYPSIAFVLRHLWGSFPFSVGDIFYTVCIILALIAIWRWRRTWKAQSKNHLVLCAAILSAAYFLFNFLWALNYHREKLSQKLTINTEYSNAQLLSFTRLLIAKTNSLQHQITGNDSARVVIPYSQRLIYSKNVAAYGRLAQRLPYLEYQAPSVKPSLFSLPLTYMGFAGYFNPFTGEAQVNDMVPMYNFPTTAAHEMAHQLGYASESEANFIGFLASIHSTDPYLRYSGYSFALRYCLRAWALVDVKRFKELKEKIHPGVLKNYKDAETFWAHYESIIDRGFKIFYDHFLKWNDQKDGVESYSKFVDLMINYYGSRQLPDS